MTPDRPIVHPYIPNSIPAIKAEMLAAVGASSVEDFYADIPESLRLRRPLDLPPPYRSEVELVRHVGRLLDRNVSAREVISFLGAGCYQLDKELVGYISVITGHRDRTMYMVAAA